MVNTKIIADLPIELGIKRTYKGYFFLIAALELAITDQKNLLYMSKSIFSGYCSTLWNYIQLY